MGCTQTRLGWARLGPTVWMGLAGGAGGGRREARGGLTGIQKRKKQKKAGEEAEFGIGPDAHLTHWSKHTTDNRAGLGLAGLQCVDRICTSGRRRPLAFGPSFAQTGKVRERFF